TPLLKFSKWVTIEMELTTCEAGPESKAVNQLSSQSSRQTKKVTPPATIWLRVVVEMKIPMASPRGSQSRYVPASATGHSRAVRLYRGPRASCLQPGRPLVRRPAAAVGRRGGPQLYRRFRDHPRGGVPPLAAPGRRSGPAGRLTGG